MDFAALDDALRVENNKLDLEIRKFGDVSLRGFLAEYFPTGRLELRNITINKRDSAAESITISGAGNSQPFTDLSVTLVFSFRYDAKSQSKVLALLIEGVCNEA